MCLRIARSLVQSSLADAGMLKYEIVSLTWIEHLSAFRIRRGWEAQVVFLRKIVSSDSGAGSRGTLLRYSSGVSQDATCESEPVKQG
jgi:hypothetical protein